MSRKNGVKLLFIAVILVVSAYMGWRYKDKGIQIDPIAQAKTIYANTIGINRYEERSNVKEITTVMQTEETQAKQQEKTETVQQPKKYQVTNISSHLTVRSEPSKNAQKVGSLDNGTVCQMKEQSEDGKWMRITTESGVSGWVSAEYLTELS